MFVLLLQAQPTRFDRCRIRPLTSFSVLSLSVIIMLAFVTIFVFIKNKDIDENSIQIILSMKNNKSLFSRKRYEFITASYGAIVSTQTDVTAPRRM